MNSNSITNGILKAIAILAGVVIGYLWYAPFLFGKLWMKEKGLTEKDTQDCNMPKAASMQFALNVVVGYVLAGMLALTFTASLGDALLLTFWLWLGFNLTREVTTTLWAKNPLKVALIDSAGSLATMLVMGAILFQWG